MNKVILIPDSFKGTMSSSQICKIMKEVILSHYPKCEIIAIPIADGGEGTVDAFLEAVGGEKIYKEVTGPYMGEKVKGYYALLNKETAVLEMAAAASLPLVGERKNPSATTTYGVGELLLDAASKGVKKIILGLGGSATNDAGCGAAAACGVSFYDDNGDKFIPLGASLDKVAKIDLATMDERLKNIEIITMCDINNPFYGKEGASYIYAPQKGADSEMVKCLDANMRKLAALIKESLNVDVQAIPGSGAAGGMGGGMVAFFNSHLQMGIDTILDTVAFDSLLEGADFVYTGEGKIDEQSLRGKVVVGVARRAKAKGVKVNAFVGDIGDNIIPLYAEGVSGIFSINREALPYEKAKLRSQSDLALTIDNLLRFQKALLS